LAPGPRPHVLHAGHPGSSHPCRSGWRRPAPAHPHHRPPRPDLRRPRPDRLVAPARSRRHARRFSPAFSQGLSAHASPDGQVPPSGFERGCAPSFEVTEKRDRAHADDRWEGHRVRAPARAAGLEAIRAQLPDSEPWRAWSNFTFTAGSDHVRGAIYSDGTHRLRSALHLNRMPVRRPSCANNGGGVQRSAESSDGPGDPEQILVLTDGYFLCSRTRPPSPTGAVSPMTISKAIP
jgi:hypothetical protein